MRLILLTVLLFSSAVSFAGRSEIDNDWTRIEFNHPREVKNPKIINSVDIAVARDVYWEDEGYEFEKQGEVRNVKMKVLYKESGDALAMEVEATADVAGFGWWSGYRTGTAYCEVLVFEGDYYDWTWDGNNATANCEVEFDLEE